MIPIYPDYKKAVVEALQKKFGKSNVTVDNKAIKIKASGSRRSSDVIAAIEFRQYNRGSYGRPWYESGICFFTSGGTRVVNYPEQHSENCTTKHGSTNNWFKPTVRMFKNMRSRAVEAKISQSTRICLRDISFGRQ